MARFWKLLVLICFLIIIDQIAKGWAQTYFKSHPTINIIDGFFYLTYVENTGAAFGVGQGAAPWLRQLMFLAVPTLFSLWVGFMLIKTIKGTFHMSLAYALILAGAVGNLIDRFTLGYVVDFFLFYYWPKKDFPVFNVADTCITVAAILLIGDMFWQMHLKRKAQEPVH